MYTLRMEPAISFQMLATPTRLHGLYNLESNHSNLPAVTNLRPHTASSYCCQPINPIKHTQQQEPDQKIPVSTPVHVLIDIPYSPFPSYELPHSSHRRKVLH